MARIYLAFSSLEASDANKLRSALQKLGHDVELDVEKYTGDWSKAAEMGLQNADVFVPIFGKQLYQTLTGQTTVALGYAAGSGRLAIIPVLKGTSELPENMKEFVSVRLNPKNYSETARLISELALSWVGRKIAKDEKAQEVVQRIEERSSDYIEEAIHNQKSQARANKILGLLWYALGFICLIAALLIVILLYNETYSRTSSLSPQHAMLLGLRVVVIVGLLGAAAKYGLSLGRSYTSESLKNLDRIHAISFGKFYLRAYGETATWQELKEVFQNWNIDRVSSFSTQDTSQIDPGLSTQLLDGLRAALTKGGSA